MAEKSVYESSLMGESPIDYTAIASRRVVTQVTDNNQGSYNGWIRFNSNSFAGLMTSFEEGVISTPVQIVATNTGSGNSISQWVLGLKNGTVNLYDQVEFKLNGVSIITPQVFNNVPAVFIMLASWSQDTLRKIGPSFGFWPDSVGSIIYQNTTPSVNGVGFCNNIDVSPAITLVAATAPEPYNEGFYMRQRFINSYNSAGYGGMTGNTTSGSYTAGINVNNLVQVQKSYTSVSGQVATFNLMLNTRLPDLGNVFKKIPLCEVGTIELNLGYNQFNPTVTGVNSSAGVGTLTQSASGLQFGNTCPFMVASAATANGGLGLITAANSSNTFVMTVGKNALTTGCTLTIPQYELTPEYRAQLLSTRPIQTVRYERTYYQVQTAIAPGGQINTQVVPSITNPKWLLSVPAASVGTVSTTSQYFVAVSEPQSCFDSFPGTTMPLASISQYQVNLGTQPVFSSPVTYEYDHFLNNVSRIEALNGGTSDRLNSGLINEFMWTNAMRYYVADLSRQNPENAHVPKSVNVLGINNSSAYMDLHSFLQYEDEFRIFTATGVIEK